MLLQCLTARICFSPAAATYLITDARPPFFARNIRSATRYVVIAAPHRSILAACAIYHHRAHCHITLSSTPALTPSRFHTLLSLSLRPLLACPPLLSMLPTLYM